MRFLYGLSFSIKAGEKVRNVHPPLAIQTRTRHESENIAHFTCGCFLSPLKWAQKRGMSTPTASPALLTPT